MTHLSTKTCVECRHHSTFKRPRVIDATGFDDQLMFEDADKDETVYFCRAHVGPHADKEVGTVPITCSSWEGEKDRSARLEELDRRIAEFEARSAREKE